MITHISPLDSFTAPRCYDPTLEIKSFSSFECPPKYPTSVHNTMSALGKSNAEMVSLATKKSTVSNEGARDEGFIQVPRVVDRTDAMANPRTAYCLSPQIASGRIEQYSSVQIRLHEIFRPIGYPYFMLCSEEWLIETQDPDEAEILRPVHVDRTPSLVLDEGFRDVDASVDAMGEHSGSQDCNNSSGIFEYSAVDYGYHEKGNCKESPTMESSFCMLQESGISNVDDIR